MTLAGIGSRELFSSLGSADGFLSRVLTSACFQLSGKVAAEIDVLMMLGSLQLILVVPKLKMWWGHGSSGSQSVLAA